MTFLKKEDVCRLCCFTVTFKTRAIVILWLSLFIQFCGVICTVFLLEELDLMFVSMNRPFSLIGNGEIISYCVFLTAVTMNLLPTCLALVGIYQWKPLYLKPYVFMKKVKMLFCLIAWMAVTVSLVLVSANRNDWMHDELISLKAGFDPEVMPYKVFEEPVLLTRESVTFLLLSLVSLSVSIWFLHYCGKGVKEYKLEMQKAMQLKQMLPAICVICDHLLTDSEKYEESF